MAGASLTLDGLQLRLAEQYGRLSKLREVESYPVYAIEHGLEPSERDDAQRLLNAALAQNRCVSKAHWLVWIAAAAEVGYGYDGVEYWDSFARAFPNWPRFGNRNLIRSWYQQFQEKYHGLAPAGPWARQFPIIAWPITQAILPRYLQRHFAEHLTDLRAMLVRSGALTLEQIGDLLCERYYGNSSRFEGFLQQKALTARLVMALRLEGVADAVSPIEQGMLERIVRDFDRLGSLGKRLRETRQVLRDARFINTQKQGYVGSSPSANSATTASISLPRMNARRAEDGTWNMEIALPDLATFLKRAEVTRKDLDDSRMRFRVAGQNAMWNPGRALLAITGETSEPIKELPKGGALVLEFDKPLQQAVEAMRESLLSPQQPLRLLKLRGDSYAVEIFGRHVRASHCYLIVTPHEIADVLRDTLSLERVASSINAHVWKLAVPRELHAAQIEALKQFRLGHALGLRVTPVGLAPRWAASKDTLEFVDGETPQFAILSDLKVTEFSLTIDGQVMARLRPSSAGPTIFAIKEPSHGEHVVRVSAIGTAVGADLNSEEFTISIRAQNSWPKAISGKAGLSMVLNPRGSTLDDLFERKSTLVIRAPDGRNAKIEAKFYQANGESFHTATLTTPTPVPSSKITAFVASFHSSPLVAYLERAARVDLCLSLDEYGAQSVSFEKQPEALRWVRVDGKTVKLANDNETDEGIVVECFDLASVDVPRSVGQDAAQAGIGLSGRGGLLIATQEGRRYEALVTTLHTSLTDFSELAIPASVSRAGEPDQVLRALLRWSAARRMIGPMAFIAKSNAVAALDDALQEALCGLKWMEAVRRCEARQQNVESLYGDVFMSRGFASGLMKTPATFLRDRAGAEAEFGRLAGVYKVSSDAGLCAYALKLAFVPAELDNADANFLGKLKGSPIIRGAYFARLVERLTKPSSEVA